jgi:multisubunit Na+/H+ antiporter MnhF subunit
MRAGSGIHHHHHIPQRVLRPQSFQVKRMAEHVGLYGAFSNGAVALFGLLFLVLGILKGIGLAHYPEDQGPYLAWLNPVFPFLSNRAVIGAAAIMEICVGLYALRVTTRVALRASVLLWSVCVGIAYRILAIFAHYTGPCGCLFGITNIIPLRPGMQRLIADVIVACALLASVSTLCCEVWLSRGRGDSLLTHSARIGHGRPHDSPGAGRRG